jgi:hypothetical protein
MVEEFSDQHSGTGSGFKYARPKNTRAIAARLTVVRSEGVSAGPKEEQAHQGANRRAGTALTIIGQGWEIPGHDLIVQPQRDPRLTNGHESRREGRFPVVNPAMARIAGYDGIVQQSRGHIDV